MALLAASGGGAAEPVGGASSRWHFRWPDGLELTVLFRRSAAGDETRLLVASPAGRFELVSAQDAASRTSEESVRSLDENEVFSRRLLFSGTEDVAACSGVKAPDACVVFSGKNGSLATGFSAFSGRDAAAWRRRASDLASEAMRRRLLALAPLSTRSAEFAAYRSDFLGLVWPAVFGGKISIVPGTRAPACSFDAGFGVPCSEAERAREGRRFAPREP